MQVEKVVSFWDTELVRQPQTVYRAPLVRGRSYYTLNEDNEPSFYVSATSITNQWGQKGEPFYRKMAEMGYDGFQKYSNERAEYGTLMHILFGKLIVEGKVAREHIKESVAALCLKLGTPNYQEQWYNELCKDVQGFKQFMVDYKVVPLAVEMVLVSKKGFATAIDLVCRMTIQEDGLDHANPYKSGERKGQPRECKVDKEIYALLNFKSGRKGFFAEHSVQLEFEKMLFEENFPNIKIERIFNYAPTDWRGITPTYKLKDQSDSLDIEKAKHILALGLIDLKNRLEESAVTVIPDVIGEGEVTSVKLRDWIKNYHSTIDEVEMEIAVVSEDGL